MTPSGAFISRPKERESESKSECESKTERVRERESKRERVKERERERLVGLCRERVGVGKAERRLRSSLYFFGSVLTGQLKVRTD